MGTVLSHQSCNKATITSDISYKENLSIRQRISIFSTMKIALALCLLGLKAAQAVAPFELVVEEWETWKLTHGKVYRNYGVNIQSGKGEGYGQEEKFRMKIW